MLVKIYDISTKERDDILNNHDKYGAELRQYQREFTSYIFEVLDPDEFIKEHAKYAGFNEEKLKSEKTLSDEMKEGALGKLGRILQG